MAKINRLYSNEILPTNQPIAEKDGKRVSSFFLQQIHDRRKQFREFLKKDWGNA